MGNPNVKFRNPFYNPENPEVYRYNPKTGLKMCSRCGEHKPISEFYKIKRGSKDGYFAFCKKCNSEQRIAFLKRRREENARYRAEAGERRAFEKRRKEERLARKEEDRLIYLENRRKRRERLKWKKNERKRRIAKICNEHKKMLREISALRKKQVAINAERRKNFYRLYPDELFTSFKDLENRGFVF